jgi:hypothetical protein
LVARTTPVVGPCTQQLPEHFVNAALDDLVIAQDFDESEKGPLIRAAVLEGRE